MDRITVVLVVFMIFILNGCTSHTNTHGKNTMASVDVLYSGISCSDISINNDVSMIKSMKELTAILKVLGKQGALSGNKTNKIVSFEDHKLLFIRGGSKPTGGYNIIPNGDRAEISNNKAMVLVKNIKPSEGKMVTQTVTCPWIILSLSYDQNYSEIQIGSSDGKYQEVVSLND